MLLALGVKAQDDQDVLRYSQTNLSGDARFVAMGGAFSAIGANFSSLSTNPAGLALYRGGDFMFTPAINIDNLGSKYVDGKELFDQKTSFNISNAGLAGVVWEGSQLAKNQWRSVSLGFGMNRTNDFNSRSLAKSYVPGNSRLDDFTDLFNEENATNFTSRPNVDPFYTGPLYNTYLLEWDSINGGYSILDHNGGITQRRTVETSGATTEMVFSAGGNFSDYLYVGATIGVPFLRYYSKNTYYEDDTKNEYTLLNNWSLVEHLDVQGTGVNIKLGAIVRPTDYLRVGLAFHSPTYYSVNEDYYTEVNSSTTDMGQLYARSYDASYDYRMQTPSRVIVSAAGIIGKYGMISAEYEFVNYRKMKLRMDDDDNNTITVNDNISANYQSTGNLRVGGEVNLAPFRLRAGYQLQGNPYADEDWSSSTYSGGIGLVLNEGMYLDVAYAYIKAKYSDQMYPFYDQQNPRFDNTVKINEAKNQIVVTFGVKF